MRFTDHDTGELYHLDMTPELKADLALFRQSACKHAEFEVRQRRNRGGATHFYKQCIACGRSIGSALKKSPELINAPAWKEGHENSYLAARDTEYRSIIQKHVRKQRGRADGFNREYDIYLASPEWQAKRAKILKRANGICEGCLERKATQVHHLTYEHVYHEFMFELIAVCDECHARLHIENKDDGQLVENDLRSEWEDGHPCDGCRHGSEQNSRRWCFLLDQYAADALADWGDCGPRAFHVLMEAYPALAK